MPSALPQPVTATATLAAATPTTIDLNLNGSTDWTIVLRNTGANPVTAVTIAVSPLGDLFEDLGGERLGHCSGSARQEETGTAHSVVSAGTRAPWTEKWFTVSPYGNVVMTRAQHSGAPASGLAPSCSPRGHDRS